MSGIVESFAANQKDLQATSGTLSGTAEAFKKLAADMGSNVKEATEVSDQLTNTVTTYKEALMSATTKAATTPTAPQNNSAEDPRLSRDVDRKQRQILIELSKEYTEGKSVTEIKEKIDETLGSFDPPAPEGAKIQEINKLRNGGVIIQLKSKEAAEWLRISTNEMEFLNKLDTNALIKDKTYPIVIPKVPLTFEPTNEEHLREVESMNDLPPNTITKARWIKPEYRRHPNQRFAYGTFSLNSITEANTWIRDGMYICSTNTYPKRLKYEPKQCMKCRKWGHFASECHASADTCGTCGGEHATRECKEEGKRFCVSCRSEDHASWDRACPEFLRKSAHFDELHPENAPTYFPTEEERTHSTRPERIPVNSRFPMKYAVGELLSLGQPSKQRADRNAERKGRKRGSGKDRSTQGTLDNFVEKQLRFASEVQYPGEREDEADEAEADSLIQSALWN